MSHGDFSTEKNAYLSFARYPKKFLPNLANTATSHMINWPFVTKLTDT